MGHGKSYQSIKTINILNRQDTQLTKENPKPKAFHHHDTKEHQEKAWDQGNTKYIALDRLVHGPK